MRYRLSDNDVYKRKEANLENHNCPGVQPYNIAPQTWRSDSRFLTKETFLGKSISSPSPQTLKSIQS